MRTPPLIFTVEVWTCLAILPRGDSTESESYWTYSVEGVYKHSTKSQVMLDSLIAPSQIVLLGLALPSLRPTILHQIRQLLPASRSQTASVNLASARTLLRTNRLTRAGLARFLHLRIPALLALRDFPSRRGAHLAKRRRIERGFSRGLIPFLQSLKVAEFRQNPISGTYIHIDGCGE